jgi:predicted nucleic acid-binding Zn ribbon protein
MTYLYETIPAREGETPKHYELHQGMNEAPLTRHPETGEPIRRVILGGWGATKGALKLTESGGDCCSSSGCC